MNRLLILIVGISLVVPLSVKAQAPFLTDAVNSDYNRGKDMYDKEKYVSAIYFFDLYVNGNESLDDVKVMNAEYLAALSSIKLFHPDAEYRMTSFIGKYPESPNINDGYMALANYFFQNKNYRKAIVYYEKANRQLLDTDDVYAYCFRLGYSYYLRGDKDRALLMFSEIKDIDTEYTAPAIYYFSQIAYERKMYRTAREGFERLKDDESFGAIVPFYIVQMLYLEKDYDGILETAPELLKSAGKERAVELYCFIGDAYYHKGMYAEALPYLEKYASSTKISGREDKYQLAYSYYKTGSIDKAITMFLAINSQKDVLSQNVWYVLGDCYLIQGNKKRAQFGFSQAARMDFDKHIQQEALFNYAKITYETSYSPFGEAIASFQKYIELFPSSERIQEVYNYLVSAYLQDENYKAALASLDKIANKDEKLEEAYQKVAFFRGLELFGNLEFGPAIDVLDKSLKYGKYNRNLMARAIYWKGEAFYRLGNYEEAKNNYTEFLGIPGVMYLDEYIMVRYSLGSAFFNLKNYNSALVHFKNFESNRLSKVSADIITDARNRIADCYYITTDYSSAISYYDKVIDYGKFDSDYAMYQKGFSLGLMNRQKEKADILTSLINRYPSSSYIPVAYFERGRAYVALENYSKGESDFETIINNYSSTVYTPKAMLQLGLLYYNTGKNEKAIEQYKNVIEHYKSTEEARYAMTGLKNTYVGMNDVESYFAYTHNLHGYGDVSVSEKDSLLYTSGENLFMAADYDKATEVLGRYIAEFPNGIFLQNARYYLAESRMEKQDTAGAIEQLKYIISEPNSRFTEQALIKAASIVYSMYEFEQAYEYYSKLETVATNSDTKILALSGQLRSAYEISDAERTIAIAEKIGAAVNVPEELSREATFMKAKANLSLDKLADALADFKTLSSEVVSSEGAESKYRVAEILYRTDKIDDAEKIVNEFISMKSPHQYWMGRIFILLSDICVKKGDMLQAKVTLESVRDYYTIHDDGILDEVKSKLKSLENNQIQNAPQNGAPSNN